MLEEFYETHHIEEIFKALVTQINVKCCKFSTSRCLPTFINILSKYLHFKQNNSLSALTFDDTPYYPSMLCDKILSSTMKYILENKLDDVVITLNCVIETLSEKEIDLDKALLFVQLGFSDAESSFKEAHEL